MQIIRALFTLAMIWATEIIKYKDYGPNYVLRIQNKASTIWTKAKNWFSHI